MRTGMTEELHDSWSSFTGETQRCVLLELWAHRDGWAAWAFAGASRMTGPDLPLCVQLCFGDLSSGRI